MTEQEKEVAIPRDAVFIDVDYYADGFYSGQIWLEKWHNILPEWERRETVLQLIKQRHPKAQRIMIITAKYSPTRPSDKKGAE